ncbi:MAG TPA: ABC-2 transporter permease [Candidatus Galloscillospira excrementavium]|nr:ABC-2 transporter permease [Candidatus Galloscillospira excrementavium]
MIGMVCKDILVLRKQMLYYLFFIAVYTVLVVAGVFPPSILPAVMVIIGMLLPMSSFGFDDQAHWEKFAAATPAGRRDIVAGKYLFALLSVGVTALLVLALMAALAVLGLAEFAAAETLFSMLVCIALSLIFNAITLPVLLKFGAEKSRIISIVIFVAVFGGVMLLGQLADSAGVELTLGPWLVNALPMVLAMVCVGALVISYFVALGIYQRKEF